MTATFKKNIGESLYEKASTVLLKDLCVNLNERNTIQIRDVLTKLPSPVLNEFRANVFEYLIEECVFKVLDLVWIINEILKQRTFSSCSKSLKSLRYENIIRICGYLTQSEIAENLSSLSMSDLRQLRIKFRRGCWIELIGDLINNR